MKYAPWIIAVAIAMASPSALGGKHFITGEVVDRNGKPVEKVIVSLMPGNVELVTDRDGRFLIDYLRGPEGQRIRLEKRTDYDLELYKPGFHLETRSFYYKKGAIQVETVQMTEDTIEVHGDNADLQESLVDKPTHSSGANYEGQ